MQDNYNKVDWEQFCMDHPECLDQMEDFPYKSVLSFEHLITYWEKRIANASDSDVIAKAIKEKLKESPELRKPIKDMALAKKHQDSIDMMMTAVIPDALKDTATLSVNPPFGMESIYATSKFKELFQLLMQSVSKDEMRFMKMNKYLHASFLILNKFYNTNLVLDVPMIFHAKDPNTDLDKYFHIDIEHSFADIVAKKKPKELSQQQINQMLGDMQNIDLWKELLPPDNFEFQGFITFNITDVTMQEVVSSIKNDLLARDAVVAPEKIIKMEQRLRSLFNLTELRLGMVAFNKAKQDINSYGNKIWNSILTDSGDDFKKNDPKGSIFEKMMNSLKPVVVEDLEAYKNPTAHEKRIMDKGFKSVVIAPMYFDNEPIGMLELASPNACDLNSLSLFKLHDILPLFCVAAKRSIEELQNQVQAVIKEKYTAIHPAVEWRFVKSVSNYIQAQELGNDPDLEPIIFKDVFPLYGQSDIRGSSTERTKAIQSDLLTQLNLLKKLSKKAIERKPIPIYEELLYRVNKFSKQIQKGLSSGDELSVHEFINEEAEPMFFHLGKVDPIFGENLEKYRKKLDPEHGFLYDKRKDYEESVTAINKMVSDYLEVEEDKAQEQFPHYFEKYKTDGVEYTIYTGQSLMQHMEFGPMYLHNLRLWQMMVMCETARKTYSIQHELKVPLSTTHLILVYSAPMSIQFRVDEKQFDVEGAYNMRYEIVKKRIDKANVKGSQERLTQPDKIVIIYSQHKEHTQYMKFIEFLQDKGYLEDQVEELEVEALQGVAGLKALRVSVKMLDKNKKALDPTEEILQRISGSQTN